jgi:hypothetical protein
MAFLQTLLWSDFSTNSIRSAKKTCSSDSSEPIAFVCLGKRNQFSTFRGLPLAIDAMLIMSFFPVPTMSEKRVTKKVNLGSFG